MDDVIKIFTVSQQMAHIRRDKFHIRQSGIPGVELFKLSGTAGKHGKVILLILPGTYHIQKRTPEKSGTASDQNPIIFYWFH